MNSITIVCTSLAYLVKFVNQFLGYLVDQRNSRSDSLHNGILTLKTTNVDVSNTELANKLMNGQHSGRNRLNFQSKIKTSH